MPALDESTLEQLVELCGILPAYTDIAGRRHVPSVATKRALLESMGIDTSSTEALAAAMAERMRRQWGRVLAPVCVVREDDHGRTVAMSVPDALSESEWCFELAREDGSALHGTLRPSSLRAHDRHDIGGAAFSRYLWPLPELPCGYHRLRLSGGGTTSETTLIVAPRRCYLPETLDDDVRVWGPAVQLFALRSHRNWGMGDFTDLRAAIEFFGQAGAGTIGLGPLHSLYPHVPEHTSPYSPSSRLFWNVLYIDIESVPGFDACEPVQSRLADPAFRARIAGARDADTIDYTAVAMLKRELLELQYQHFRDRELASDTANAQAFRRFEAERGEMLRRHALYEALAAHFHERNPESCGWPDWPQRYARPEEAAVAGFAARNADRVTFFAWLQWLAEEQLAAAGRRSAELGLALGLYMDLPLGVDGGGSDVWARSGLYARGAAAGAPPDDFNLRGQNWGLPPWIPERLFEAAYQPFIDLLRHNMRHAGALRIDHVMGLMRLFWIPAGAPAAEGAYVRYPLDNLLGILALESQRNRCAVIGEDLGTVPDELRAMLAPMGVLSNRLLYFEKRPDGEFRRPAELPRQALAAVSNHDLPTLTGFWNGEDIELRQRLGFFPDDAQHESQVVERAQDRARVLFALEREDFLPEGIGTDPAGVPELPATLMIAIHRYLARSPAMVLTFQLEDALGIAAQVNLPGTTVEYPNWRQKLPLSIEQWSGDARLSELLLALREERGAASAASGAGARRTLVVPGSTYRVQLNSAFTFGDLNRVVPYLQRLGVTHCYLSPYLKARPGSSHGYDVIDHAAVNPEIGTRDDLDALCATLLDAGMGQIVDVVPNHMGVMGSDNAWWLDVLENGQASPYAEYFDIDWGPVRTELRNKVLIPVLGDHYGVVLERGELTPVFSAEAGELCVRYHEHTLPLDPTTYGEVLGEDLDVLAERLGEDNPDYAEFQSILRAFERLPSRLLTDDASRKERCREQKVIKRRLAELCRRCRLVREHIETNLAMLAGTPDRPESFARLHRLLERQPWRLAYWQVAADEINYRRFFDINELAALRMERPGLLKATHALLATLYRQGAVDGFRVDHIDGLYDPAAYLQSLQALLTDASDGEAAAVSTRCYVVVEKILAAHEHLREDWPIDGTTGYDFAFLINGLTIFPDAEHALDRCYRTFTAERVDFDELLYECKKLIIRVHLSSELTTLANLLNQIAQTDWHTRDFTLNGIRDALTECVACFPVYRTYVTGETTNAADAQYVDWAISWARQRDPGTNPDLYEFIRRMLLLDLPAAMSPQQRALCERFAMKFQQYAAPIMAKASEDTCFYRYCRLVSLNEVGGDPRRFGVSVPAFHRHNQERLRRWPHAMLAGSTHDNKRSEDVRARLNVLTELPSEWRARVGRWRRLNRALRRDSGANTPSRRDEYLFYQSLLGIWPLEPPDAQGIEALRDRLAAYMLKAAREAKERTNWSRPDEAYEAALSAFVRGALDASGTNPFLADAAEFAERLAPFGLLNSLTQTVLRLTAPGVPDLYQGSELWDFSLVDPDNRRPVDYRQRDDLLGELERRVSAAQGDLAPIVDELMGSLADGRAKLYVTWRLLRLRMAERAVFDKSEYLPLTAGGACAEHLCAFARRHGDRVIVVLTGRWFARLRSDAPDGVLPEPALWSDTWIELPEAVGPLRDELRGVAVSGSARLPVGTLLAPLPAAVLVGNATPAPHAPPPES